MSKLKFNDVQKRAFVEKCQNLPEAYKPIADKLLSKTNKSEEEIKIITGDADLQTALIKWYKSKAKGTTSLFAKDMQTLKRAIADDNVSCLACVNEILERFKLCFTAEMLKDAESKTAEREKLLLELKKEGWGLTPPEKKKKAKKKAAKTSESKDKAEPEKKETTQILTNNRTTKKNK